MSKPLKKCQICQQFLEDSWGNLYTVLQIVPEAEEMNDVVASKKWICDAFGDSCIRQLREIFIVDEVGLDKKVTRGPIKIVMVRRGLGNVLSVPTKKLRSFIRKRALLGTDEISGDGKSWIQIDHHYQLRKFFPKYKEENVSKMQTIESSDELEVTEIPEDVKNKFRQVADLLNELNG